MWEMWTSRSFRSSHRFTHFSFSLVIVVLRARHPVVNCKNNVSTSSLYAGSLRSSTVGITWAVSVVSKGRLQVSLDGKVGAKLDRTFLKPVYCKYKMGRTVWCLIHLQPCCNDTLCLGYSKGVIKDYRSVHSPPPGPGVFLKAIDQSTVRWLHHKLAGGDGAFKLQMKLC